MPLDDAYHLSVRRRLFAVGHETVSRMEKNMKALIAAAAVAAALSLGAVSAEALDETNRAMGAGPYVHPNGPSVGADAGSASGASHFSGVVTRKKR